MGDVERNEYGCRGPGPVVDLAPIASLCRQVRTNLLDEKKNEKNYDLFYCHEADYISRQGLGNALSFPPWKNHVP